MSQDLGEDRALQRAARRSDREAQGSRLPRAEGSGDRPRSAGRDDLRRDASQPSPCSVKPPKRARTKAGPGARDDLGFVEGMLPFRGRSLTLSAASGLVLPWIYDASSPLIRRELADVGAVVQGTIEKVTEYGAFVKLESGESGMVHISQVDVNYVKNIHDFVHEGDTVQVKVIGQKEDGKIDLSIKQAQAGLRGEAAAARAAATPSSSAS